MAKEEILLKLENYDKNIQEKLQDFITGCFSLKESSNGQYQVQKTIELNKIYFQGYVLDSKICKNLKEDNVTDYSLTTLKNYLNKNFNNLAYIDSLNVDDKTLKRIINYAFRMVYYIRGNNKKLNFDFEGYFQNSDIIHDQYFQECLKSL